MKILVTGAKGFVGRNLCAQLNNILQGKARNYPVAIDRVMEFDVDSTEAELDEYCREADFVFNLAGVNRPQDPKEFMEGNFGFASKLLATLERHGNRCPVMISSSTQAALSNPYGESKRAGERLMREYSARTGAKVLIYRFPNLFGKWCRPNYNSAVATFCNNIANSLPITVNNPATELTLLYIDDLVDEMIAALGGGEHRSADGEFCEVPVTHRATLGRIVDLLNRFHDQPDTLMMPEIPAGSFAKKLYSTYLSYLPADKVKFGVKMNCDDRGSFTELLRTAGCGQVSVNISRPGITKGQHWHNSKWEFFIVVAGHALIQLRREVELPQNAEPLQPVNEAPAEMTEAESALRELLRELNLDFVNPEAGLAVEVDGGGHRAPHGLPVLSFSADEVLHNPGGVKSVIGNAVSHVKKNVLNCFVSGKKIEVVHMLPGFTHNIINLSDSDDLVTVMWANEPFDPNHPDTFFDPV